MTSTAPLNALRAFEAAARTGSFAAAARELGVSSPAVSQQVKHLEEFWQQSLFIRQGNRLFLTDAGQMAYPQLAQAMGNLTALSDRMQSKRTRRRQLVLSVPHSVAETWLPSRLAPLDGEEAAASIEIRVDNDPVDFVQDRIDVRIFFGHDLYGDYQVETLFSDRFIAVASPDLLHRFGTDAMDIPDRYLIHTHWGRGFASSPNWEAVFQGARAYDRDQGMTVQSSSTALNFARYGFGAALIPSAMASEAIVAEQVQLLHIPPLEMTGEYRVAYPKRLRRDGAVHRLVRKLSSISIES